MPETFMMVSNGGLWNYGCEAIARCTAKMLQETFIGCNIESISYQPDELQMMTDTPIVFRPVRPRLSIHRIARKAMRKMPVKLPWYKILDVNPKIFKRATCVLSLGGDIYTPRNTGLAMQKLEAEKVIIRMGIPVVLWGTTVGPFVQDTEEGRIMTDYLKSVSLITARESRTMDYLNDIGVGDHAVQVTDPAFSFEPEMFNVAPLLPKNKSDVLLAVNLSPMLSRYLPVHETKSIEQIGLECVKELLDKLPVSIVLVPHVVGSTKRDDDFRLLNWIYHQLSTYNDRLSLVGKNLGARKTKYLLSQCDGVVAARMHCAIAGLSSLVPTICISYSTKSIGVLGDLFNNQDWIIKTNELSADVLTKQVHALLVNRDIIKKHIAEKLPAIKDKSWLAVKKLKEILK